MEFLKLILGEELYKAVSDKVLAFNNDPLNKDKQVNIANLGSGDYVSKRKFSDLETKYNSKINELEQANNLINEFKNNAANTDEFKSKIGEYENTIKDLQATLQKNNVENALKVALLNAKVTDVDYLTYKLKEQGELELDDKGEIKDINSKVADLKVKFPTFFEGSVEKQIDVNKLPKDNGDKDVLTREVILKKSYAERNELYEKDPEAYKKIMNS